MPHIAISNLGFSWPDGTRQFDSLNTMFGAVRTGLVGLNGSGKSTLLRLIAGELQPERGSVTVSGDVGYLPQQIILRSRTRIDEMLGIAPYRKALHRIEAGSTNENDFDVVGGRWDVEERAIAVLAQLGLDQIIGSAADLDRTVATLSGGETVLVALSALLLAEPAVLLLDEPTNNLDRSARHRLYDAVQQFTGVLVLVSHDRELLDRMDTIAELRSGQIRQFGGNFTDYEQAIDAEQEAAQAAVADARRNVRRQSRELTEARIKLDRRNRYGKKMFAQKREPKIVMGLRRMQAQESAGKLRNNHVEALDSARSALADKERQLRDDREIRVELPATQLYSGQQVVELNDRRLPCGPTVSLSIDGPERIALTGPNGVGKTTLLEAIAAAGPWVPWRMLPQRLDIFDEDMSVLENVARKAPHADPQAIRAQLARFLFRGADADVPAKSMSGGERLRAALATLLLGEPAPQFLMLDEPTNNLDLASREHLTQALNSFRGALLVVSHDIDFLERLGITRWAELTVDGLRLSA
ncbi:ABC-F family ATP-binding cassette domain-containing protein [Skermania sp. ID1734]|uniref:ATP-binding cassette domain-containing protein n=1 Tax=Skermania sp. ID1734 TaxID=2597516 RepID=UPI001180E566|nr:ATP-binding cassette domain-containing protein [Skermania sp. ID1734]TSE01545.1 ABC-F family ATP-binding cassette domain-containing protein [Skermania sp. ID1734]